MIAELPGQLDRGRVIGDGEGGGRAIGPDLAHRGEQRLDHHGQLRPGADALVKRAEGVEVAGGDRQLLVADGKIGVDPPEFGVGLRHGADVLLGGRGVADAELLGLGAGGLHHAGGDGVEFAAVEPESGGQRGRMFEEDEVAAEADALFAGERVGELHDRDQVAVGGAGGQRGACDVMQPDDVAQLRRKAPLVGDFSPGAGVVDAEDGALDIGDVAALFLSAARGAGIAFGEDGRERDFAQIVQQSGQVGLFRVRLADAAGLCDLAGCVGDGEGVQPEAGQVEAAIGVDLGAAKAFEDARRQDRAAHAGKAEQRHGLFEGADGAAQTGAGGAGEREHFGGERLIGPEQRDQLAGAAFVVGRRLQQPKGDRGQRREAVELGQHRVGVGGGAVSHRRARITHAAPIRPAASPTRRS